MAVPPFLRTIDHHVCQGPVIDTCSHLTGTVDWSMIAFDLVMCHICIVRVLRLLQQSVGRPYRVLTVDCFYLY